jgi:hypothetical protein
MIVIVVAFLAMWAQGAGATETWRVSLVQGGAMLSLGEPADASIQMRCVRPRVVRAYLATIYMGEGPQPHAVSVQGSSGRSSFPLSTGADKDGRFSTDIPLSAGVMASFARDGWLRFRAGRAHISSGTAHGPELQAISAFLGHCRG